MRTKPQYLAIEGADGTGKSTLAKTFSKEHGYDYTYEPFGDTPVTSKLREFALDREHRNEVDGIAREYLMLANRAVSTKQVDTSLQQGKRIVTDRSLVSGMVYAKVASGMGFIDWWEMAKRAFYVVPSTIVHVSVDKTNIDITRGDIYDSAPSAFHEEIRKVFPDALDFFRIVLNLKVIEFRNDFSLSPEANAQKLFDML